MTHYQISYHAPHLHFIDISITVCSKNNDSLIFQLPAWRPGRYELGNFSKNIKSFKVFDEKSQPLEFKKLSKDSWEVNPKNASKVTAVYNYYANTLDAGSTYLDEQQLYVNPVNCCMYVVGKETEICSLELLIPEDYQVACGLKKNSNGFLEANCFDQLAESPFIASNSLVHDFYEVNGILFHIWIQGQCQVDFDKIKHDFKAFTKTQIESFDTFPVEDYHFLFQITPYISYHGVEHTNSTVILIGSENDVFKSKYDAILGICSHELYHTWNIKAIRPKDFLPYDYTKENYSRLGYVAEGVTTYMGDLMLKKANVFNWSQFIKTQNDNLKRHYENDGRFNLSVADSAFDTWLDGYQLGIPNKKTSIYADGALNMLMIDLLIIEFSRGKNSLNTVMNKLYLDYRYTGYTETDFKNICIEFGGQDVLDIFKKHVYGTEDYTPSLKKALTLVGFDLEAIKNPNLSAQQLGFFYVIENEKHIVTKVQNNSAADLNKLVVGDEILSIDNVHLKGKKLNDQLKQCSDSIILEVKKRFETVSIELTKGCFYPIYELKMKNNLNEEQLQKQAFWAN